MTQLSKSRKPVLYVFLVLILASATVLPAFSQNSSVEKVDLQMATRIRQEGFHNSKVMEIMADLSDRLGQRLTASANQKRANEWARDLMTSWGLQNSHLESFPFGRGWHTEGAMVTMTSPDVAQMYVIPKAWTPGTNGAVKGEVVHLKATTKEDLDKAKGTLTGRSF